jgi:hypothetical protein
MASTAQEIVAPGFLAQYAPDLVIVMNGIYRDEIVAELAKLQLSPDVIAL